MLKRDAGPSADPELLRDSLKRQPTVAGDNASAAAGDNAKAAAKAAADDDDPPPDVGALTLTRQVRVRAMRWWHIRSGRLRH